MNHCMSGTHLKALFSQEQFTKDYFRYFQVRKTLPTFYKF